MTSTSHLNIINLQVFAEDQMVIDKANGTYAANTAADSKYYLWQGEYQTVPVNMLGDPELYAARLRDALPEVTTLRLPFNMNSFNEDGSLHPEYERFLEAAAKEGFNFIMVQMEGDAQDLTADGSDALEEMRDALEGPVYNKMETAWTTMLDWMDAHPSVKDAVYAYEIVNEPASYNQATYYGSSRAEARVEFIPMYAEHMVKLGQMIGDRSDAKVMVGGWNYSGQFDTMANMPMGDGSALDYIREGLGDRLVWSAHLYPGWLGTTGMSTPDEVHAMLDQIYADILGDAFIITETNAQGNEAYNLQSDRDEVQGFTASYDWFADHGVAISWFTGSQYGASNLVRMDDDGTLRFVQQESYGAAMDAFSLGGEDATHAGDEKVQIELIKGHLRNQTNDPDYDPKNAFDVAQYLGLGLGHGGNDTLEGSDQANNFLYGGTGNDSVLGNKLDDFLYGQDGNDTVDGGASGVDHLFGGSGNDRIISGAGHSQVYGGKGGDTFIVHPMGETIIVDYSPADGDTLIINDPAFTSANFRAQAASINFDSEGAADLRITLPSGGAIIMLGMGARIDEVVKSLRPVDASVAGITPVSEDEVLWGRSGTDVINGGAGNDIIHGDPNGAMGTDNLDGGVGNDKIYGGGSSDRLQGGDGKDTLQGGNGDDTIGGGKHDDVLHGEAGNDTLWGDGGTDALFGGGGSDVLNGGGGNDNLSGGAGNDTLNGDGGTDALFGGGGSDVLNGGGGNDNLSGEAGNDTLNGDGGTDALFGGDGSDALNGGSGNDKLDGGGGNDELRGEKGIDALYGGSGQDALYGGTENDRLYGDGANDRLFGEGGDDALYGGSGYDQLNGGVGNDVLYGDGGKDTLQGEDGHDILLGGSANDVVDGGKGNDILFGDGGNDWIDGGSGHDVATGGSGSDTFVFSLGDDSLELVDFTKWQKDVLRIDSALLNGKSSLAALQEHMTDTAAGLEIEFDNGDSILLQNFHGALTGSSVDFF